MAQVVQLFENPFAGSYSAARMRELVRALEAAGARVIRGDSSPPMPEIAEEATHVCIAAGDGTVRLVAGAVARSGRALTLGIFPSGTVNLLAMEAEYPRDPAAFARLFLRGDKPRRHYPVAIGSGYFLACAGVGPDSLVVDGVSPALKRRIGRFAYAVAAAGLLVRWPRHRIALDHAGGQMACEAFYVAKGRYYGGRWSFADEARVHEPVLHVVALETARRRDYLRFVWALARRHDVARLPFVRVFTCTALRADAAGALPLQADGDTVGALPATLTLCEEPLQFC